MSCEDGWRYYWRNPWNVCSACSCWQLSFCSLDLEQGLEGKIMLSLDAWTSSNQYAFLAIVAHYITNEGHLGAWYSSLSVKSAGDDYFRGASHWLLGAFWGTFWREYGRSSVGDFETVWPCWMCKFVWHHDCSKVTSKNVSYRSLHLWWTMPWTMIRSLQPLKGVVLKQRFISRLWSPECVVCRGSSCSN